LVTLNRLSHKRQFPTRIGNTFFWGRQLVETKEKYLNNQKVFRKKTFAQTSIAISSKGSSQPRRMIHRAESPIILLDSWGFPEKGKKLFGRGLDRSCAKSTFIYNTTPTIYPRPFFRKNTPIDILCTFLYNYCHMITVSVSYAREKLPELINRAYQGEEFLILKNITLIP